MKIVIFGATGSLGSRVVDEAIALGHSVTALVRSAGSLQARSGLTVVVGQLDNPETVASTLAGADVAISTIGPAFRMGSRRPVDLMQRTLPTLISAIESAGVGRFILTSAFGVGDTAAKASGPARLVYRLATAPLFHDKAAAEAQLFGAGQRQSATVLTTIVYPVNLKDAPATGTAAVVPLDEVTTVPGLPTLPFADAASAIVTVATAADFGNQRLLITTANGWRRA